MMKERESAFELIRILAQIFIIYYHILLFSIYPLTGDSFYKALYLPLHIGVPLYVLISGYFGIKPSMKGFIKLVGMVFVLQIPLVFRNYIDGGGVKSIVKGALFLSQTPFWFIRTYVILYLFSPLINKYLCDIDLKKRIVLIVILFYVSDYIGTIGADKSLLEGYNVVTFLLFYSVGNSLRVYNDWWMRISGIKWLSVFFILNIILILFFSIIGFESRIIDTVYTLVFFGYNSPWQLVSSVLFFMAIGNCHFHSSIINKIAKASLAVYIIHGSFLIKYINPVAENWFNTSGDSIAGCLSVLLLTIVVLLLCTIVYWAMSPIWKGLEILGGKIQSFSDGILDRLLAPPPANYK